MINNLQPLQSLDLCGVNITIYTTFTPKIALNQIVKQETARCVKLLAVLLLAVFKN